MHCAKTAEVLCEAAVFMQTPDAQVQVLERIREGTAAAIQAAPAALTCHPDRLQLTAQAEGLPLDPGTPNVKLDDHQIGGIQLAGEALTDAFERAQHRPLLIAQADLGRLMNSLNDCKSEISCLAMILTRLQGRQVKVFGIPKVVVPSNCQHHSHEGAGQAKSLLILEQHQATAWNGPNQML